MIQYLTGNILDDDAEALVNTVNTVGVMGKGIALQFKRQFPNNFAAYKRACDASEVEPGSMFVWESGRLRPRWVVNFPTKRHWKASSRIEDIEAGLRDLQRLIVQLGIASIAVPPLGCGSGGLNWCVVQRLMDRYLNGLEGVDVRVYEPVGAPAPSMMPPQPKVPRLTIHRAAMVATFSRYLRPGFTLGRLEAQKLIYFLKVAGAPFDRVKFVQGTYGPYSDAIRHVLNEVEGHFLEGFGDAATASTIRVDGDAAVRAEKMLDDPGHERYGDAVELVADLTEGFDDAFGLELLASVHWVATHGTRRAGDVVEATRRVHDWNARKRMRYDEAQVGAAWQRLAHFRLLPHARMDEYHHRTAASTPDDPVPDGDLVSSAL